MNKRVFFNLITYGLAIFIGFEIGHFTSAKRVGSSGLSAASRETLAQLDPKGLTSHPDPQLGIPGNAITAGHDSTLDSSSHVKPQFLTVPIDMLTSQLHVAFDLSLQPNMGFLQTLGVPNENISDVQKGFSDFHASLEELEKANAKLVHSEKGDFYEILPFNIPDGVRDKLSSDLARALGVGNWRKDFLLGALWNSHFGAGFGEYRQELAIQAEHNDKGETWSAIHAHMYDKSGREVNDLNFEVKPGLLPPRYGSIFIREQ